LPFNYSLVSTDAPVTSAVAAGAFENVDCSDTTPTPGAATLSIVEQILSIVEDIDIDTDATLSIVEHISSVVDTLNNSNCCSLVERIDSIVEDIEIDTDKTLSIVENISSTVDVISVIDHESLTRVVAIESIVERISSIIEGLSDDEACDATPITQAMIDGSITPGILTLSNSGTYCFAGDLTGSIAINGSSITLDLNGHSLTQVAGGANNGVSINPTAAVHDIRIKNGLIQGSAIGTAGSNGININGATHAVSGVRIENITATRWFAGGITATTATQLLISDTLCYGNSTAGLELLGSSLNCVISNSEFNFNFSEGVIIDNASAQISFEGVTCNQNTGSGFVVASTATGGCIEFTECTANANGNTSSMGGFSIGGSGKDFLLTNCYACGNTNNDGFATANTVTDVVFIGCVAEGNSIGFSITTAANSALVRGCTASNNTSYGFQDSASHANRFYSNIGCNNHGTITGTASANYNPTLLLLTANVAATSAGAGAFQNIDCTTP
jgi:hypothetical protein